MSPQLPQTLIKNSFNILGLSTAATLKEIRQRYQQLLQFAKIEEIQEFETDIGYVMEWRHESELKLALERISGIRERLREVFFWFDDHNKENKEAVVLIAQGYYQDAINILDRTDRASLDWLGYKNLALAFLFQAFHSGDLNSFCRSLELWKNIVESEDFWKFYEKHYLIHDELGTSHSLFKEFKNEINEYLSGQTVSFHSKTKNPKIIGIYYDIFAQIGKSIDIEVLRPVVLKIKKEIADLEKIVSDEDRSEKALINSLRKIKEYFLEIDKFEVSEYSPLTILRNDSAEKLRSISIDIYNQSDNIELSNLLLDQSERLAVSDTVARNIEKNREELKNIAEHKLWETVSDRFDKIKELIKYHKILDFKKLYFDLDCELAAYDNEPSRGARFFLLTEFCSLCMDKAHDLFNKEIFGISTSLNSILYWREKKKSIYILDMIHGILVKEIDSLICIDKHSVLEEAKETITEASNNLRNCEIESLWDLYENYDNQLKDMLFKQEDTTTQAMIAILGRSAYYSILYRRAQGAMYVKIGKFIGIVFFVSMICFMPGGSRNTSSSLSKEEKKIIAYLEKNDPELLKSIRKEGHSDKKIAQYVIEHTGEEEG